MSVDKIKKKLDRILQEVQPRIGEEVGGLIGGTLGFSDFSTRLISKEDFFDEPSGKQIFAEMQVTGDIEGDGCLLVTVKDAIRLGGTLIMLPESELEEVVASEEYSDEIEDSYGEIANIIAGSYTKTFEEMYPKSCRFIRKEQQLITPVKVDGTSDELIPNQNYYQVSNPMVFNDKDLGVLTLLLPAAAFGVDDEALAADEAPAEEDTASPSPDTETAESESTTEETLAESAETPEVKAVPKISPEKAKQKLNKVLEEVQPRISEEVGGLIGGALSLTDFTTRVISKEDFFDEPSGKLVFAEMQVTGDIEGDGCLLVTVKDAVRLGGTLIMLPESELEAVVASEDYSEEIEDSYGEIANIISGSYTKTFEEMFPKACRFIRKELQLITPVKVDGTSDELIPCQNYYQISCQMAFNDKKMGTLTVLLPAAAFGVDEIETEEPETAEVATEPSKESGADVSAGAASAAGESSEKPAAKTVDIKKQKKRVDTVLAKCISKMQDEVGAILGTEITLSDPDNKIVSKEDYFFDEASGKQILAHMDVVGDSEDNCYLYVGLKDAIYIGGTLIMLPPAELEIVVADEEFSDDTEDAYGEIANIIAGVYTSVFEEQYPKQLRFIKTGLEKVIPLKVDTESDSPMPDQDYYLSSARLSIGAKEMGNVQMLFPASLLELDQLGAASADGALEAENAESASGGITAKADGSAGGGQVGTVAAGETSDPDFLIVSNDEVECGKITAVLDEQKIRYRVLSHKESVGDYLPGVVKAIFLLMTDVNENGMGVAIKISGISSLPLIAAGPEWTRSKVIKAVKYGVDDILITPAASEDIAEKIRSVTASMAA